MASPPDETTPSAGTGEGGVFPPFIDHSDYIDYVLYTLRVGDVEEAVDFSRLFAEANLERFAIIKHEHPGLFYGQLLPGLRVYPQFWVPDFERAVEQVATRQGAILPPAIPITPTPLCPALPTWALCNAPTTHAAPWLEAYVAHSRRWSPRGIAAAHHAVGVWILSTIAAGRIYCQVGPSTLLPTLFLAMVARSTMYAKSTTAHIGRDLLKRAGCAHLLTADRTTPQALLKAMAGLVPPNYAASPPDVQDMIRQRLAFAAQRGAYMEEWGGMLSQMRRSDSPMAEFHTLLRVLDDGQATFSNDTIARGLETLSHPYLALLASATPHDLAPYMAPGSAWWHDGFWPRFAIICPGLEETPVLDQRERHGYAVPGSLIVPLHNWHTRLGIPTVTIDEVQDAKDRPTGFWRASVTPLPQHEIGITEAVYDAYEAYNKGLLTILQRGELSADYDASYGRFHDKALRIALLLTSLAGDEAIGLHHWSYAQQLVEGWRQNLHTLVDVLARDIPLSKEEITEQKVLMYLDKVGQATARDIQRHCNLRDSGLVRRILDNLLKTEQVMADKNGRATRYGLLPPPAPIPAPSA